MSDGATWNNDPPDRFSRAGRGPAAWWPNGFRTRCWWKRPRLDARFALGLFNCIRRRIGPSALHLGETGIAGLDCPYVEQNGILAEAGREEALTALCLRPLVAVHNVVLSGVGDAVLAAARRTSGRVLVSRSQASPFIDLAAVRRAGGDYLIERSANTRQQIRRSDRFYERTGPIVLERAGSVASAHAMLDAMAEMHQTAWRARGKPGSFARPFFRQFHRALIEAGLPRREVALLKISCKETVIGILYNFIYKGRMSAYQSGFDYRDQDNQAKPGLTGHHAAIRYGLAQGLDVYDFLAGEDRYKRSLASQSHQQFWIESGPFCSPRLLWRACARLFG